MNFLSSPLTASLPSLTRRFPRTLAPAAALSFPLHLARCRRTVALPGGRGGGTTPVPGYLFLTGNWEFQITPNTGTTAPFTALGGFINEQGQNPGHNDQSTAVFQVAPAAGCYNNIPVLPMSGNVEGLNASYSSFSVDGQYFSLKLSRPSDTSGNTLTGTYSGSGGCIKSVKGTVTGTLYTALTGTYAGSIGTNSPAPTVSLTTSQSGQGTGSGTIFFYVKATF